MKILTSQVSDDLDNHLYGLCMESETRLKCYEKSVLYLVQFLQDLKHQIVSQGFNSKKEEIHFFKHTKPRIVSKLIYYTTLYNIEPQITFLKPKETVKFYKKELLKIQLFFEDNKDLYHYYTSKSSHFDNFYFRRNRHNIRLKLDPFLIDSDLQFSTSHDYKIAQLKASENLKEHFESKLSSTDPSNFIPMENQGSTHLKWTATKTELSEIIHALHGAGVFNNGVATIKLITEVFESMFGITSGDVYGALDDFKKRKDDPAFFLNRLKEGFYRKIGFWG